MIKIRVVVRVVPLTRASWRSCFWRNSLLGSSSSVALITCSTYSLAFFTASADGEAIQTCSGSSAPVRRRTAADTIRYDTITICYATITICYECCTRLPVQITVNTGFEQINKGISDKMVRQPAPDFARVPGNGRPSGIVVGRPSRTDPLPRITTFAPVSDSSVFSDCPRGPISMPMKFTSG